MTATPTPLRERGPMVGTMLESDFTKDTITFHMPATYYAAAGRYIIEPEADWLRRKEQAEAATVGDATRVFNCHRCPVSVESRWQPPDCPECGDPCELDVTAKPATPPASGAGADDLLEKWCDRYNELIRADRTYEAEQVLRCINEATAAKHRRLAAVAPAGMDGVVREEVDREVRGGRIFYFRHNPPNTMLAQIFNNILLANGTYEADNAKHQSRENAARAQLGVLATAPTPPATAGKE